MSNTAYLNPTNPEIEIVIQNMGSITVELFPEIAPNTVYNFLDLIEQDYFKGSIFHRVIPSFMIQGGANALPLNPIKGEFESNGFSNPILHERGVISMARTSNPNSATSQFFIMHQNAPHLDKNYAAFGIVKSGIELVDSIVSSKRNYADKPFEDQVIVTIKANLKGKTYPKPVRL